MNINFKLKQLIPLAYIFNSGIFLTRLIYHMLEYRSDILKSHKSLILYTENYRDNTINQIKYETLNNLLLQPAIMITCFLVVTLCLFIIICDKNISIKAKNILYKIITNTLLITIFLSLIIFELPYYIHTQNTTNELLIKHVYDVLFYVLIKLIINYTINKINNKPTIEF